MLSLIAAFASIASFSFCNGLVVASITDGDWRTAFIIEAIALINIPFMIWALQEFRGLRNE